ncbi:NACHT domain-containing protein [Mucilaginibacter calamicampi]|uniref:NACHT domain-containing protein n=1 Tax=Mucilaginibacter calamicampi TaxID=1302352 RepID=A0ABW2Z1B2_9SPHI
MNKNGLTWKKLKWEDFQKVSLFLLQKDLSNSAIEEYLRQGHFQAGIDLYHFEQSTGKYVCIQCKHTDITLSKLKVALSFFLSGEFADKSEAFIITTTTLLQNTKIQTWISEQKITLREQKGIAFDVLDRERLNDRLVWQFRIVEKYFGIKEAVDHCFQPSFEMPEITPIPEFIGRDIQKFNEVTTEDKWHGNDSPHTTITLTDLLSAPLEKGICVIGEAYEGKSSLFKQTAWELNSLDLGLRALLLDLKFCSVVPIANLLDTNFGTWMEIPAKNLILLIDGLDEVPAEQFHTVTGNIRDFQKKHPAIRLALSCRKIFYRYQNLDTELSSFDSFELAELHMRQIFDYMEPRLGGRQRALDFYAEMNGLGIADLLGIPFYLINLTKWFSDAKIQMPKNKMAIADRFVDESLQISSTRKLRMGLSLERFRVKYRNALQQLALLLQIRGLNACNEEDLQQFFSQEDIDLLTHSSILNIKSEQWSFINALFQEQLAALALLKLDGSTVIDLVTVGDRIKKVSRKWIQTLATYLSLLSETNVHRNRIVDVIEADNIELLALSEGSKFSQAFRLEVLQKILHRTIKYQARLVAIDESDLASFAGNQDLVVDELLGVLRSNSVMIAKIVACRVLRHLHLASSQADRYTAVAKELLVDMSNADLGRLLLEAVAFYKHGDEDFLGILLKNPLLKTSHQFRQGLYQFLATHKLIDQYYELLLNGFEPLERYNSHTSHFGSEKRLLDLLLTSRKRSVITQLLDFTQGELFRRQFRDDKDGTKQFYQSLTEVCAEIYKSDPLIIFPVVRYLINTGRLHYDRDPNEMSGFLTLTQTHAFGLKIALLTADKNGLQAYAFSRSLNSSCFSDLLYAVEEGYIDRADFKIFCNGLYYSGRSDEALELEKLGEQAFNFFEIPNPNANAWQKAEERKRKNDLHFISSRTNFREGIMRLFKIAGRTIIKTDALYKRFDEDNLKNKIASSYLTQFVSLQAEEKVVSLEVCLQAVDDDIYFKGWRGGQLLKGYLKRYYPEAIEEMLKNYYDGEIVEFPFTEINTVSSEHLLYQAGQLMKIWAEYRWPTNDEIILEFSRINVENYGGIRHAEINRGTSVNALLIKHFAHKPQLLKHKVLQNLESGLVDYRAIGTQFEICRELTILESLPYILDAIKNKKCYTNHLDDYMSLYILLGGEHSELLPIFESITELNDYLFMFMIKLLAQVYPDIVIKRLCECLNSPDTDFARKIEAAQWLSNLGNKQGFFFLIGQFKAGKAAPFDIQGKVSYWNVDTQWGLKQLSPLMYLLLDEETETIRFHHSPRNLMLEILSGFASKSESDLNLVVSFMESSADKLSKTYPENSGHLLWHAEQMSERFRQINNTNHTNSYIRTLFEHVNNA